MEYRRRDMGSKYFGRAIRKWRLSAGLSQEELAERAEVSVTLVGTIERERGHLSEEIFCKLCLGLESELGRPVLRPVLYDSMEALWKELLSSERRLREERGWAAAEYETLDSSQDDLDRTLDSALAEVKKLALLWYRGLALQTQKGGWLPVPEGDLLHGAPGRAAEAVRRVRVRKPGQKPKRPVGPAGK